MSYFDLMLESEDQVMINKVIENATFQMCIEGGEAVIQDVEDYVDLLMTENYEPTPQFDEYMFESLSPYLEENAKYLGMFLFELTAEENQKIIKYTKSDAEKAEKAEKVGHDEKRVENQSPEHKKIKIFSDEQEAKWKKNREEYEKVFGQHRKQKEELDTEIQAQDKRSHEENKRAIEKANLDKAGKEGLKISAQQKEQRDKEVKERSSGTNRVAEMQKNNDAKIKKYESNIEKIEAAKVKGKAAFDSNKIKTNASNQQAAKNKARKDALLKGHANLNLVDSMKKGLQKAKMKLGGKVLTSAKKFQNKVGKDTSLGKIAGAVRSAGTKIAKSGASGRRKLNNGLTGK